MKKLLLILFLVTSLLGKSYAEQYEDQNIIIVNKSSFPTKILKEWSNIASSKMASRESNIFVFIYDVGEIIEPIQEFGPGALHQVLMSPNEINESYQMIEDWFKNTSCGYVDYELLNLTKEGLEKGVDWSSQWAICTEERFVIMGLTDNMRNNPGGRDAFYADLQEFLQHELYHAFQHDLKTEGECRNKADKRDSNSRWMIEGGARFFAKNLLDDNKSFDSHILQEIYERRMGREAFEGESDKAGSAALLLMSKRGLINESEILDGSLFHDCARELKFDKNSDEIKFILKNWNNIIQVGNGEFKFSPEALK